MTRVLVAFGSGALFAAGLALSGMTLPSKVVGFLDVTGAWDPSLALVMVGAIGVHLVLRRVIMRRDRPAFDDAFHLPERRDVDGALLVGAGLFGLGWGIAGFCPGPAIVGVGGGMREALLFVPGMVAGMWLFNLSKSARAASAPERQPE